MKKEELTRAIDAINPSRELRAKVLSLRARPARPRLEHPLRNLAALGVAGLLCAGVVAAVIVLPGILPGNGDHAGPALAAGTGDATASPEQTPALELTPAPEQTSSPEQTSAPEQTPDATASTETPEPPNGEPTAAPQINAPKLKDVVKITDKGGKYYADIKLNVIAAAEGQYGLDPDWVQRAVNGEFTKEEILAEFALADERAANYVTPFNKNKPLPDGIIPPDEALAIAEKAFLDYFGIGVGDCVIIDGYNYSQMTLQGGDAPVKAGSYAGKPVMIVMFSEAQAEKGSTDRGPYPYQWTILFNKDGSKCMELNPQGGADDHTRDMSIIIDAKTGYVIGGSIDDPKRKAYTDAEQKDRMARAQQFVKKQWQGLADVKGGSTGSDVDYISVTLTDGKVILVWIREDGLVVGFMTTLPPSGSESAG